MSGTPTRRAAELVAAVVVALLLIATATGARQAPKVLTGSIALTDQTWTCTGPVQLDSVTVTITSNAPTAQKDGIHLRKGCTGRIDEITVHNSLGDGVKVASGSDDLVVGGGTITCDSKLKKVHQDGIQAMSGTNVVFIGITINCPSASNAGFFVKWGGQAGTVPPDGIIFTHGFIYPTQSSTVNVTDDQTNSGVSYSTLCPSRYYTYRKTPAGVITDIDVLNTYPSSC